MGKYKKTVAIFFAVSLSVLTVACTSGRQEETQTPSVTPEGEDAKARQELETPPVTPEGEDAKAGEDLETPSVTPEGEDAKAGQELETPPVTPEGEDAKAGQDLETPPVAPEGEDAKEESYMEKCKDMVEVMPPDGITKVQEGITYSEFQKYVYYSTTAERDTAVNVLLPPDYSEEKEYPVLYILHGYFDNEDWMARPVVGISKMLSNLYANKEAEEMIVVVPYIYCSKDMPHCTGMDLQNSLNYDNFINDLTTDLMPFIENTFSVAAGRENTAVTGFSMGGREALFIGFSHPEVFGYIGAVCPAPGLTPVENSPMHPGQMEESELAFTENPPYVLLVSAAQNDGVVGTYPYSYHNMLNDNGTEHIWHTMPKTGHDHSSVTPHLYNFFRLVFRDRNRP